MDVFLNVFFRTLLLIVLVFFLFKLIGKKQIAQMSMFDYIVGITLGSIVADISLDISKNLISGIVCLLLYGLSSIIISYLCLKSIKLRNFFNGREDIIMENGKIIRSSLARNRITIDELVSEARQAGYFNMDEINMIVLESNGKFSFDLKERKKPTSKDDIGLKVKNSGLVYNLIIDGVVIKENVKLAGVTVKWLNQQLNIHGKRKEDILLLTITSDKKINIYDK